MKKLIFILLFITFIAATESNHVSIAATTTNTADTVKVLVVHDNAMYRLPGGSYVGIYTITQDATYITLESGNYITLEDGSYLKLTH